jgi:tetratricopeptide (TPR) repeat protein
MNKIHSILLFSTFLLAITACNKDNSIQRASDLYQQALTNKDASTAKFALNQLVMLDSTNLEYQDSLSRIYMRNGNFDAGIGYAEEVYNAGKANQKLQENMALAYQQVGETEKAEAFLEKLLMETNDYKYLYQKLVIHYENGNQMMFDSLSSSILTQLETDSVLMATAVPMPGPYSGVQQSVPMEAATLFLIGNNALERKQDVQTGVAFLQKSIQKFEQFEYPRYVLQELEKMIYQQRK